MVCCYVIYCVMPEICLQAITHSQSEEYQQKAWQAVLPIVSRLKQYYEFSVALGGFLTFLWIYFTFIGFFCLCCIGLCVCLLKCSKMK